MVARLGTIRLDRLTPLAITRALAAELEQGRGTRRLRTGDGTLRLCLARAVRAGGFRSSDSSWVTAARRRGLADGGENEWQETSFSPCLVPDAVGRLEEPSVQRPSANEIGSEVWIALPADSLVPKGCVIEGRL